MRGQDLVAVADRVVLVTGGRRGLGSALVDEVLARGARKVYSTARHAYRDERIGVAAHELEVRSDRSVSALAEMATDTALVINNAGVLLPGPLLTSSMDEVAATFDVNVFGALRVTRAFAPILARNGGGLSSTSIPCFRGSAALAPTADRRRQCGPSRI